MISGIDKLHPDFKLEVEKAAALLKKSGCREVFVFGSLADGTANEHSDIDLAVSGCPPEKFYEILGKLLVELRHSVDLVDIDNNPSLGNFLKKKGLLLNVIG